MRRAALLLIIVFFVSKAWSNPAIDSASIFFENGKYDDAITIWQSRTLEHASPAVFYNLGLAYQKAEKPLDAIYSFEQALRLKPWSSTIRAQLNTIRGGITDPVIPASPFFLQVWVTNLVAMLRPGAWAIIGLLIFLILVIHFISIQRPNRSRPILLGRLPYYLTGIGLIVLSMAGFSFARLATSDEALTTAMCELRQGPAQESPVLRSLSAGEKIEVLDVIGSWRYVKLANLDKGWMQSACIKPIRLPGF